MNNYKRPNLGVLGASGYLGKNVCEKAAEIGMPTVDLGRKFANAEATRNSLGVIIDAAFPTNKISKQIKSEYMINLRNNLDMANDLNLRYIYIGSYSSHSRSRSKYGQLKREAERLVILKGANILRVGLITDPVNPKGRYQQFANISRLLPFIPVFPVNWCPIFITTLEDFRLEIEKSLVAQKLNTITSVGKAVTFSTLFEASSKSTKKFYIPEILMIIGMYFCRLLPLGRFDIVKSILYKEERN